MAFAAVSEVDVVTTYLDEGNPAVCVYGLRLICLLCVD